MGCEVLKCDDTLLLISLDFSDRKAIFNSFIMSYTSNYQFYYDNFGTRVILILILSTLILNFLTLFSFVLVSNILKMENAEHEIFQNTS